MIAYETENSENAPLISVIVPAYNAGRSLSRCIESVLRQTFESIEIIIVDDGSRDGTSSICDELSKKYDNVRAVHQKNIGLSGARNTGIENAQGNLLFFLDADDYITPDEFEILYNTMKRTGAHIAVGGVTNVTEEGEVASVVRIEPGVVDERGFWECYERGTRTNEHSEYVISCGKLFDSAIFRDERFDLGKIHEDEFIIHRLVARSGMVAFADTAGYNYVQTDGSIMHSPSATACLDTAEGLLARCSYFESRGWWDFAFTALCEVRGALSNSIEADAGVLENDRFRRLKAQWASECHKVSPNFSGSTKQRTLCSLFARFPMLYKVLKGKR